LRDVLLRDLAPDGKTLSPEELAWKVPSYQEVKGQLHDPLERSIHKLLPHHAGPLVRPTESEVRGGFYKAWAGPDGSVRVLPHAALDRLQGTDRKFAVAWWHDEHHATAMTLAAALGLSLRRTRELIDEGRVLIKKEKKRRLWARS
jgi:hypothetical protein